MFHLKPLGVLKILLGIWALYCPFGAYGSPNTMSGPAGVDHCGDKNDGDKFSSHHCLAPADNAIRTRVHLTNVSVTDANKITHREYRLLYSNDLDRPALKNVGAEFIRIAGDARWIRYDGYKAGVRADFRFLNKITFFAIAGGATLRLNKFMGQSYGERSSIPLWRLKSTYAWEKKIEFRLEGNNDFAFLNWRDQRNVPHVFDANHLFAEIEAYDLGDWQLKTNAHLIAFGDHNGQQIYDSVALRRFVREPFSLRAGFGGGWTRFNETRSNYWSPGHFENYGLRLEIGKVIAKQWRIETRFAAGNRRVRGAPWEKDSSADVLLEFSSSRGWRAAITGNHYQANDGRWWRSEVCVNLQIPLGP